ncbi:MAG: flagellar basal body rod protein FlgC [Sedimentisphaerales bacterium]|nr:flagellar basal body rod protein FlgC [Sedimentisphaerales bacterium]
MNVDNFFSPLDISISGLKAQGKQMEVISSNVANARTSDAGNGEPYRRLEASFKTDGDLGGVELDKILPDMGDFLRVYDPGNPQADGDGYVAMPNINLPGEMINLNIATRVYQANVAVLKRYQRMVENTLELLR